jgi:hypothetical protein
MVASAGEGDFMRASKSGSKSSSGGCVGVAWIEASKLEERGEGNHSEMWT